LIEGAAMRIRDWDLNLKIRLFGEALMNITYWMFFPFLTIYFANAFGKELAGLLLIISQLFSVLANLMGGHFADKYGRKTMMVLSSFGQGLSFILFASTNSPWLDMPLLGFVFFSLAGVFGAFYWPASQAMVTDVVDEKHRSGVFAIFYTSINISYLLKRNTRETAPVYQTEQQNSSGKWYGMIIQQIKDYKIIFNDRAFLLYIIAGVLVALTFMQLDMLLPVYITEMVQKQNMFHFGDWSLTLSGDQLFGLVLSENGLLVALFTIIVTKWMNTYKEKNVFVVSSIIYGIAIATFGLSTSVWVMILAMGLFTFAELMTAGIQQTFVSKISPEHMRGQYFAAASLRNTIGRTIAPVAIPMSLWFGYLPTFVMIGILALISGYLYYVMFQMAEQKLNNYVKAS